MNKRIWTLLISFAALTICVICGVCITFYFGVAFERGPFSPESRAEFLIRFQGGTRIVMEPDVAQDTSVSPEDMERTKAIISRRLYALGIDSVVKLQENRRLTIDLPGNVDTSRIISAIPMGILDFIDADSTPLQIGAVVHTTGFSDSGAPEEHGPTVTPPVYRTVMTGKHLSSASIAFQPTTNQPYIQFTLTNEGAKIFAEFTSKNINKYLAVVIDKKVITSPIIKSAITGGHGIIEGQFTQEEANNLVIQLKYGALPFPLKIIETTTISQ